MDEAEYRQQLNALEDELANVYRKRRELLEAFADTHPAPPMPRARNRTDAQMRIARCPRCGGRLSDEPGAKS